MICEQPYIIVSRKIDGIQQEYIENKYWLVLSEHKLNCKNYVFDLNDIYDVSFRKNTNKNAGTLYLHTNKGVYPYQVCSNPVEFIECLKNKINKKTE